MHTDVAEILDALKSLISDDEMWVVYGYKIEEKAQSGQWKFQEDLRLKNLCQVGSNVKVLWTVSF